MISKGMIAVSRPRFWLYTFGPFLIGIAASGFLWSLQHGYDMLTYWGGLFIFLLFIEGAFYFLYGANLFIYGVNDLADGDTDQYNVKKMGYEQALEDTTITAKSLRHTIILIQALFFIMFSVWYMLATASSAVTFVGVSYLVIICIWLLFLVIAFSYSAKPIRAKAKPLLDGLFNVLYVLPGLIGFLTFGGAIEGINRPAVAAGRLRCIAMHTFSAIPDIDADKQAGLTTTAVYFGYKDTLLYCGGVRLRAARLAGFALPELKRFFYPVGGVYLLMLALCLHYPAMTLYKWFPWLNGIVGFLLFWLVALL